MPTADCRSHPPAPVTITALPRPCDPHFPSPPGRGKNRAPQTRPSRIIRCVEPAKNVDRIARLQVASGECRIGVEREVENRERADPVKSPDRDTLHQVSARMWLSITTLPVRSMKLAPKKTPARSNPISTRPASAKAI